MSEEESMRKQLSVESVTKPGSLRAWSVRLLLLSGLVMLTSCQRPLTVLVGPEGVHLKAGIEDAVASTSGQGKIQIEAEGAKWPGGPVLRLTTTPGWNLPAGIGPAVSVPADWDATYSPPEALAALGISKNGSWSSVPILYDVWGQTSFAEKQAKPLPPGDWRGLRKGTARSSLSVAGSRPSFRQTAYLLELFPDIPAQSEAASWFDQAASRWKAPSAVLPSIVTEPAWGQNAWFFGRGDQAMSYKQGKPLVFLETFRDYESTNVPGVRRFVPLDSRQGGKGYAMAGTVLFMEYRGDERGLEAALPLMRALAGNEFQKRAGMTGGWLAVNRTAPEIDGTGATIRRLVAGARRFFPVTDRLPDPLVEGSLWVDVQLAVDSAPRK